MAKRTDPLAAIEQLPHVADDAELNELQARRQHLQEQLVSLNDKIQRVDAEIKGHDPSVAAILESGELGDTLTDLHALESQREQLFRTRDAGEAALARLESMISDRRQAAARELGQQAQAVLADAMVEVAKSQLAVFDAQHKLMELVDELAAKGGNPSDAGLPDLNFFNNPSWWQAPSGVGRFAMAHPFGADVARTWFASAFARVCPSREAEIHKLVK